MWVVLNDGLGNGTDRISNLGGEIRGVVEGQSAHKFWTCSIFFPFLGAQVFRSDIRQILDGIDKP